MVRYSWHSVCKLLVWFLSMGLICFANVVSYPPSQIINYVRKSWIAERSIPLCIFFSVFYLTAFASSPPIVSAALVWASVVTWVYVSSVKPAE